MKIMVRRLSVWACAVGVVLFSTACRNTAAGFKRDTEDNSKKAAVEASKAADKASAATVEAAQRAAQAAEAGAQTVNVKTALIADKRVTAKGIDVDTDLATRTVILKGHVPSEEQKAIAEQIASKRSSGYHVRNELTVGN
jgi:osmotically-inducible protein OsmY